MGTWEVGGSSRRKKMAKKARERVVRTRKPL